jgi:hypothetical protein
MFLFFAPFTYLRWHYGTALVLYIRILQNQWWWLSQLVTMRPLFVTPLPSLRSGLGLFITHIIVRLGLSVIGFGAHTLLILVGIIGYILWITAPWFILWCYGAGSYLLITSLI